MLWILSAEMQKWLDQNHTSRSTNPISAPSAASMRALASFEIDLPARIGDGFGSHLGRHLVGTLRGPLGHRGASAICCRFASCSFFARIALACRFALASLTARKALALEGRESRSGSTAVRVRRSARRAGRPRWPQSIPGAAPCRTDGAPARLQPLRNCSWQRPERNSIASADEPSFSNWYAAAFADEAPSAGPSALIWSRLRDGDVRPALRSRARPSAARFPRNPLGGTRSAIRPIVPSLTRPIRHSAEPLAKWAM